MCADSAARLNSHVGHTLQCNTLVYIYIYIYIHMGRGPYYGDVLAVVRYGDVHDLLGDALW